ncbi:ATP-binding cassette sub- A member 5 [Linnemannia zychae]|nr:ATP-binding cassette sub- A member 5 [Linnemannia zychae]
MSDIRRQTPSPPLSSQHQHHNHDDIQGIDIVKATRKPTKMDHFRALVAHNFRVTLRDPTVYILGTVIPIIMIGTAVGISLGIQSGIPKIVAGSVETRVFTQAQTGLETSFVTQPVAYFPVVRAVPDFNSLTDSVSQNLGQIYQSNHPVFANFSSMDDIALYEHSNGEAMLKNKTLKDYKPQLGFELDSLAPSTSTPGSLDLGFSLLSNKNDSIPFLLSALNAFTQNVDAISGANGTAAGLGMRFLSTLKTFPAQGSENVDIPSNIVPSFMTFAFSFFTTFVASNLVNEKEHGQKQHLQNMGIKPITYYLARYVIDLISYLIPVAACFVILAAARLQMITSGSWVPYLIVLLFAGFPIISFGYLLSLPFQKTQAVGQVLGIGLSLVVFVPYFFVQFVFQGASNLAIVLIGCVTPTFAMERAIASIAIASTTGQAYTVGDVFNIQYPVFCAILVFIGITFVHFSLIFWAEHRTQSQRSFFRRTNNKKKQINDISEANALHSTGNGTLKRQDTAILVDGKYREQDAEVIEETLRLKGPQDENDAVRLMGLSKKFYIKSKKRDLVILDDVYLAFKRNECFGYLGPNGAGKTTTIKILTGAESPTSGGGTIEGLSIAPFHDDLRSMIGICPQFDIIWPKLTVRDHLELFAKIKGVAPEDMKAAVDQMIDEMGLGPLGNKRAKTFSGGNKRRLSLAMAVIGCPKVVFLDEPTTGVDVAIRQAIWNSIRKLKKTSCVILTTHSMEEADALCDRIGIITNGHIRALGTSQRLKNTYGAGYKVIVKSYTNPQWITAEMERTVGAGRVTLVQALGASLEYELTRMEGERTTDMLAKLFTLFEQKRKELGIEDYSVSQTTLAQVFIEFAKEQAAPEDK